MDEADLVEKLVEKQFFQLKEGANAWNVKKKVELLR